MMPLRKKKAEAKKVNGSSWLAGAEAWLTKGLCCASKQGCWFPSKPRKIFWVRAVVFPSGPTQPFITGQPTTKTIELLEVRSE